MLCILHSPEHIPLYSHGDAHARAAPETSTAPPNHSPRATTGCKLFQTDLNAVKLVVHPVDLTAFYPCWFPPTDTQVGPTGANSTLLSTLRDIVTNSLRGRNSLTTPSLTRSRDEDRIRIGVGGKIGRGRDRRGALRGMATAEWAFQLPGLSALVVMTSRLSWLFSSPCHFYTWVSRFLLDRRNHPKVEKVHSHRFGYYQSQTMRSRSIHTSPHYHPQLSSRYPAFLPSHAESLFPDGAYRRHT